MADNIKMKAVDTLHISSVGPHSLLPGEEFEVPQHVADDLEKRGLASRAPDEGAKSEAAPLNKAEKPLSNKAKAKGE